MNLHFFSVNLLSFATGNVYSWSSSALIALKSSNPNENPIGHKVTPLEESLITSLLSLGAICGPLLTGILTNMLGRKPTLIISAIPMLISNVILMFASTTLEFYVARFMVGLGAGSVYTVVPIYVGEIAETEIRGLLGGFMGTFYTFGLSFNYAVGPFFHIQTINAMMTVPILSFLVFFGIFIPESPHYYVAKGKKDKARNSLKRLRNHYDEKELAIIEKSADEPKNENSFFSLLESSSFKRAIILTSTIVFLAQLAGITAILSYMEDIFIASGSSLSSSTSTILVAIVQVCLVVLASCLVDKLGRRLLLIVSNALCGLALFPLGLYFFLKHYETDVSALWFLPILCVLVFFIGYNIGLSTIPWTLVGELFSNETKAIASTITTISAFGTAFIMALLFPHCLTLIGFYGIFWFCSCMAILNVVFIACFLPETKGKTFSEILIMLQGDKKEDSYETLKMSSVVIN